MRSSGRRRAGSASGENLTVGEGVSITLPSEQTVELYTEIEFTGTETGSINPDAWPRHVRGVGTHWIDHCLIAADDPGLIERFFHEALDFRTAERVIESMENPERIGVWMTAEESHSAHDLAIIKGPDSKLHHFAYHLDDWTCDPAGRGHLLDGRRAHRHRADPARHHPG